MWEASLAIQSSCLYDIKEKVRLRLTASKWVESETEFQSINSHYHALSRTPSVTLLENS